MGNSFTHFFSHNLETKECFLAFLTSFSLSCLLPMWPLASSLRFGNCQLNSRSISVSLHPFFWGGLSLTDDFFQYISGKERMRGDVLSARPGNVPSIQLPVFTDLLLDPTVLCVRFSQRGSRGRGRRTFFNFCIISCSSQSFPSPLPVQLGLNALAKNCVVCVKRSGFNGEANKDQTHLFTTADRIGNCSSDAGAHVYIVCTVHL